jgi:serine/threonine protein kinase
MRGGQRHLRSAAVSLTVRLEDIVTGESWDYPCDRSPIIIGRNRDASIVVARHFVSGLHASIRHDHDLITFTDLDSLNGTLLDGQPIVMDQPVPITPDSDLLVGRRLRLTVRRGRSAPPPDPTKRSPFAEPEVGSGVPRAPLSTNILTVGELRAIEGAQRKSRPEERRAVSEEPGSVRAESPPMDSRPRQQSSATFSMPPGAIRASMAFPVAASPDLPLAPVEDPEPPEQGLLPPRTRLGRYYIVRLVARGGMGEVYRAEDPETEQAVAIKTLAPELTSKPEARARFLREAKVACRVTHRNIIKIFGYDIHDGIPYLIMEYLRGEALDKLLDGGPLGIDRACGIAAAVCAGMSAVHQHGIIHRDLKPSNIFLAETDEGESVKILDFGVSKMQASQDPFKTGINAIIGSLPYMSPEQAMGGIELDARSDQFSLGAILYECLTGQRPHRGETNYSLSESIVHGRFQPPKERRPEIPEALNGVIMKAMSLAPADRFASLRELGIELLPYAPAQAQRQLTDLLSASPRRISHAQVSAPMPADWFQGQSSGAETGPSGTQIQPLRPIRLLPPTETGDVATGQLRREKGPIEALAGQTQVLPDGASLDGPARRERAQRGAPPADIRGGRRALGRADAADSGHARGEATSRLVAALRRGWRWLALLTASAVLGGALIWFLSPRSPRVSSSLAGTNQGSQPTLAAGAEQRPEPSAAATPTRPALPAGQPVAATRAAGPSPTATAPSSPVGSFRQASASDDESLRDRDRKRNRVKRPHARPATDEPARTRNGVRILE